MAVRYDASSRSPGRMVDPLQSVDPWRSQAGDLGPSQTNLDARATATDPWQSYVPLSTATTNLQGGAGPPGCFVTRTQPVPGGGSTPMAFGAGLVPPVSQGAGPHGLPLHGAAVPPGFQGAGPHGLPHQAVPPGFQGAGLNKHGMVVSRTRMVVFHVVAIYKLDINMVPVEYLYTEELCP